MINFHKTFFKILYALVFIFPLPAFLYYWALLAGNSIGLPPLLNPVAGSVLIGFGAFLIAVSIMYLYIDGRGLPMSPFPPRHFVSRGTYYLLPHPIYTGTVFITAGYFVKEGSSAGFWLVMPVYTLACLAFVMGFESQFIRKLFPGNEFRPRISLPESNSQKTGFWDFVSAWILALIPAALGFYLVLYSGLGGISPEQFFMNADFYTIATNIAAEMGLDIDKRDVLINAAFYFLVASTPFILKKKITLRHFIISVQLAAAYVFFLLVILPDFLARSMMGATWLLAFLLSLFYMSSEFFAGLFGGRLKAMVKDKDELKPEIPSLADPGNLIFLTPGLLLGVNEFYQHGQPAGILINLAVFVFVAARAYVWKSVLRMAEFVANSWKEWRIGKVRVINHGFFGAMAAGSGTFVMAALLEPKDFIGVFLVAVSIMITMILWAQFIEGSDQLKRPAGFYGGVLGMAIGAAAAHFSGLTDFFLVAAAAAVCGPFAQGIGRLRCLVQGCCHGRETTPSQGIRYFHERSRVVAISHLKGKYLYPTPVYSIITNIVTAIVLFKLWFSNSPLPMILGICLIINSLSRFVEESYRGEPQTPVYYGLRLYQWLALFVFIIGIALTTLDYPPVDRHFNVNLPVIGLALAAGLIGLFVSGIDFPESNKRFSRLT